MSKNNDDLNVSTFNPTVVKVPLKVSSNLSYDLIFCHPIDFISNNAVLFCPDDILSNDVSIRLVYS